MLLQMQRETLHRLWTRCYADGLQPYGAIEQLSALVLLKQLEEQEGLYKEEAPSFAEVGPSESENLLVYARWSTLRNLPDDACFSLIEDQAIPWLRARQFDGMNPFRDLSLAFSHARALREVMDQLDALFPSPMQPEWWARVYDALMEVVEEASASFAGIGGAFYTPHHIANALADLLDPRPGEAICDLACGNGRLLISAYQHVLRAGDDCAMRQVYANGDVAWRQLLGSDGEGRRELLRNTRISGYEIERMAALQAWMHLRCIGVANSSVHVTDSLGASFARHFAANRAGYDDGFDKVIGNPPFGSTVDGEALSQSLRSLGTSKVETLFVELALQVLRSGGQAAVIVPDGVLFNSDKAHKAFRRRLVEEHSLRAIVSLPPKVFLPYTGVKTSILVFSKGGQTDRIFCYRADADGYSLDAKRRPIATNDLPDLLIHYWIHRTTPPGTWLRETQALSCCKHSAFINNDTQLVWENVEPGRVNYYYALPLLDDGISEEPREERQRPLRLFKGAIAQPIDKPKAWVVERADLHADYNLRAELYEPEPRPWGRPVQRALLTA
jgi:type I restriction enzyme M protein